MNIEMASNSGFCMGVRKAILRIVDEINSTRDDIYVFGPLIHNPQTLEALSRRGLKTVLTLDDIDHKQVAIRTHGITVDEYKKIRSKAKRVINLTCSRVARVQALIKKYSAMGYHTLIIGDPDHAEVIGLTSYASNGCTVVSSMEDIVRIPDDKSAYLLVAQTTLDRMFFQKAEQKIKARLKNVHIIDTICDSTRNRQQEVLNGIKRGINTLVVVGGKNSANTKRLAQIGRDNGVKTYHIETESELKASDFSDDDRILVTAGASTPGWIINNVLEELYNIRFEKGNFIHRSVKKLLEFIVRSNLLAGIAALFMSFMAQIFIGTELNTELAIIAFLYIFSMYSINNYFDRDLLKISNPYKYLIYKSHGTLLLIISLLSMVISLIMLFKLDMVGFMIVLPAYVFGFSYSTEPVKHIIKSVHLLPINKIYNSKIVTTLGWLLITVVLPMILYREFLFSGIIVGAYIFTYILLRHLLIDIIALQGDLILGKGTVPIWMGLARTRKLYILTAFAGGTVFLAGSIITGQYAVAVLVFSLLYFVLLMKKIVKLDYLISLKYELLVDLNFIIFITLFMTIHAQALLKAL